MPQSYFPLRWESTGDQWWYASPIDWAAANGHYDLVRELLHLDTNLLIKLTSLRRIRRLETVWDDDAQFVDAAKCRSFVARSLLHECETKSGNSLISAGYGGWLLYTAASAGDIAFVKELLERDPLLVFGEGEYGVTEIFYGAARGKNTGLFRLVFEHALFPSLVDSGGEGQVPSTRGSGNLSFFRCEILNRAVLAAARGGSLEMLKELLSDCSDVLVYRDSLGSTILHAASGRGQIEVVKELIASFDIITSKDNQGNTALHVAAFRGHLTVVEALVSGSPSLSNIKNNVGDTFLHMAVAGFRTQGFNRLDRQMELVRQLIYGKIVKIHEIINIQNNYGRTALHVAVIGKMHPDLVKLLMSIPSINLNIRDVDGMTPLDLLSQCPPSASSDVVIKQLLCAGGLSNSDGFKAKSAIVSQLKMQCGIGNSPGSSFRISDVEILLHTGIEASQTGGRPSSSSSVDKSELPHFGTIQENQEYAGKKKASANVETAARRLKFLLRWPNHKEKRTDDESMGSLMKWSEQEETPIPLRHRFSKGSSSLINNKRTLAVKTSSASPATKKKLATGLMHGVIQAMPHLASTQQWTQVSPLSRPLVSSPKLEKRKVKGVHKMAGGISSSDMSQTEGCPSHRSGFMNAKLMNQYLCFKSNSLDMEKSSNGRRHGRIFRSYVSAVA